MKVYLVRHGKTGGNVAHRHQADSTGLTAEGLQQAKDVAVVLRALEPTHLVSSSLVRALETAREIGAVCDLIPETHPVFIEIQRPPKLNGNFHRSAGSLWFYTRWYLGLTNKDKEGGETYKQFRERIHAAQAVLATYSPDARVVVVSHSVFIAFFIAHLCTKGPLSPLRIAWCFVTIFRIKNTAIIPFDFDHTLAETTCRWKMAQ